MKQEIYGHLTLDSMATHVPHNFKVPDGTKTLRLEFAHTPDCLLYTSDAADEG